MWNVRNEIALSPTPSELFRLAFNPFCIFLPTVFWVSLCFCKRCESSTLQSTRVTTRGSLDMEPQNGGYRSQLCEETAPLSQWVCAQLFAGSCHVPGRFQWLMMTPQSPAGFGELLSNSELPDPPFQSVYALSQSSFVTLSICFSFWLWAPQPAASAQRRWKTLKVLWNLTQNMHKAGTQVFPLLNALFCKFGWPSFLDCFMSPSSWGGSKPSQEQTRNKGTLRCGHKAWGMCGDGGERWDWYHGLRDVAERASGSCSVCWARYLVGVGSFHLVWLPPAAEQIGFQSTKRWVMSKEAKLH